MTMNNLKLKHISLFLLFPTFNLLYMHYYFVLEGLYIGKMFAFTPIINFLSVTIDVAIIFLFFLLCTKGRTRLSLHLLFVLTLIWSFVNIFYSRFFYQCLTISAIKQANNIFDVVVINSIIEGFRWIDCYYLLSILIYIIFFRLYGKKTLPNDSGRRLIFTFIAIPFVSFFLSLVTYTFYHFISPKFRHHPELYVPQLKENLFNPFIWKNSMPINVHFISGSIRFIISEIKDEFTNYELSSSDISIIKRECSNYSQRVTENPINPEIRNVVFILLESFLSVSSDLVVNGKEITPFLNKLRNDSSVYYNGRIQPNITIGESGDGQLIYMSGLLPLKNRITVGIAKNRELEGLPNILKEKYGVKYTEIIIPSSPVIWEQRYMNGQYGIDNMYSAMDVESSFVFLINEEKVFNLAKSTGKESKQPFFSMILGVSTHQPYSEPVDISFKIEDSTLPEHYLNYLNACHYVDQQIESFFKFLHNKNIFDNSLIVIAADHHPHIDLLDMEGKVSKDLPLYIINSGINVQDMYDGTANQLDVYTTILDILGIENEWLGLGHTLLNSNYNNSVNDEMYNLSEKIIMGDYFKYAKKSPE